MANRGLFVLAGPPGTHKTTIACETFSPVLYVKSEKTVTHYFDTKHAPKHGLSPLGEDATLWLGTDHINGEPYVNAIGQPALVPQRQTLEGVVQSLRTAGREARAAKRPPPISWLVLDEAPTFWMRVFDELEAICITKEGQKDTRRAFGLLNQWSKMFTNMLRQLLDVDIGVVLICHVSEPDVEAGRQGGAKFPSQNVANQICADADGVLLRLVKDEKAAKATDRAVARYFWSCRASQWWQTKLRGLDLEDQDQVEKMTLREILTNAGWDL